MKSQQTPIHRGAAIADPQEAAEFDDDQTHPPRAVGLHINHPTQIFPSAPCTRLPRIDATDSSIDLTSGVAEPIRGGSVSTGVAFSLACAGRGWRFGAGFGLAASGRQGGTSVGGFHGGGWRRLSVRILRRRRGGRRCHHGLRGSRRRLRPLHHGPTLTRRECKDGADQDDSVIHARFSALTRICGPYMRL